MAIISKKVSEFPVATDPAQFDIFGQDRTTGQSAKSQMSLLKGDKMTFSDLTDADIAELQQPATDAAASFNKIQANYQNGYNWNLYDPTTRSLNTTLDANGDVSPSASFDTSDFIPIAPGSYAAAPGAGNLRIYDASKAYLGTVSRQAADTTGDNASMALYAVKDPAAAFGRLVFVKQYAEIATFSRHMAAMDYGLSQYASPATEHNIRNTAAIAKTRIPFRILEKQELPELRNGELKHWANLTLDITDYINVTQLSSITITAKNGKLIPQVAFLYGEDYSLIGTVGDANASGATFTCDLTGAGATYVIFPLRRAGIPAASSATYDVEITGETAPTSVSYITNKNTDGWADEIINVVLNESPPINGAVNPDPARDHTDFIPVDGADVVVINGNGGQVSCGMAFYESKTGAVTNVGDYNVYADSYTAKVPAGAKYVIITTRRPGMTDNSATISIDVETTPTLLYFGDDVYVPADDNNLIRRVYEKVAPDKDLKGKKAAVFGSSNTTQYYGAWFPDLCRRFGMEYRIYGIGGSTYPIVSGANVWSGASGIAEEVLGQPNSIYTQVLYKLHNDPDYVPDIILISTGMNEAAAAVPVGDIDQVFGVSLGQITSDSSQAYNIQSLLGSMRWNLETLMTAYPDATFIGLLPFQTVIANSAIFDATYREPLLRMYGRMGIPVIDCFRNGGFYSVFEDQSPYKYTLDGVHVRLGETVNEKGRLVQNEFLRNAFLNVYYAKK